MLQIFALRKWKFQNSKQSLGRAGSALAGAPGKNPSPSPGRNSAISGGTKFGVFNSSLLGSDSETGFAAIAERRFPQRTRARFSPSEIKVSPAGITMRFLVQKTSLLRRYETYISS